MSDPTFSSEATRTMTGADRAAGSRGELSAGELIGSLRIERVLGRGGMGTVYAAFDERLRRPVAVKTLRGLSSRAVQKSRFLLEARALSKLDHPHICRIYDLLTTSQGEFLILELVEGTPLSELMKSGKMRHQQALELGAQIADAIASAHAAGIVHRDLKPGNVMVDVLGNVRVLDFGLALRSRDAVDSSELEEPVGRTESTGVESVLRSTSPARPPVAGTPRYMSPEQANGSEVGPPTDVFALGLLLGELWSGRPLRPSMLSSDEALSQARSAPPEVPASVTPRRLVTRCLDAKTEDRPSAEEVHRTLLHLIARPRKRAVSAGLLVVAAAFLGGGIKYSLDLRTQRDAAQLAQREAAQAFELFEQVLLSADPMTSGDKEDFTVGGLLSRGLEAMDDELGDRPLVASRLRLSTAKVLRNSGELERAEAQLRRALSDSDSFEDPRTEAEIASGLGDVLRSAGRSAEAEPHYHRAIGLMAEYQPSLTARVGVRNSLALAYWQQDKLAEALDGFDHALETLSAGLGGLSAEQSANAESLGAQIQVNQSLIHQERNDHEQALVKLRSALPTLREAMGEGSPQFAVVENNLARSLAGTGQFEEADETFARAVLGLSNGLGPGHPNVAVANHNWARMLVQAGDLVRAEELFVQSLSNLEANFAVDHPRLLRAVHSYCGLLIQTDRAQEALDLMDRLRIPALADQDHGEQTVYRDVLRRYDEAREQL